MDPLSVLEQSIVELRDLKRFEAKAKKRIQDMEVEAATYRAKIADLEKKLRWLEDQSDVLSVLDEKFLFDKAATVEFKRPARGGVRCSVRVRGRTIGQANLPHNATRGSAIKQAVTQARGKYERVERGN